MCVLTLLAGVVEDVVLMVVVVVVSFVVATNDKIAESIFKSNHSHT